MDDCNYVTVEGLTTQDAVLKDLEIHLRYHELTTKKTDPAVAVERRKRMLPKN